MTASNEEQYAESLTNLALLDPPRWGWTIGGGVADLLPPHERARRKDAKKAFLTQKRRRSAEKTQENKADRASLKQPPALPPPTTTLPAASPATTEINNASESAVVVPAGSAAETTAQEESKSISDGKADSNDVTDKPVSEGDSNKPQEGQPKDPPPPCPKEGEPNETNLQQSTTTGETTTGKDSSETQPKETEKPESTVNPSKPTNAATCDTPATVQPPATTTQTQPLPVLEKATTQPTTNASKPQPEEQPRDADGKRILGVRAVREDGSLDIYAYHRGREGQEPRDEKTGELLCDMGPTDSGYGWDAPKLSTTITISFPLYDECDALEYKEDSLPRYEDTIPWNLGDPTTPTPMIFASHVAENFGLSFGQTMDLVQSIQDQLNTFIRENCGYNNPLALMDGAGGERTTFTAPTVANLYGDPSVPGGLLVPAAQRPRSTRGSSLYQPKGSRRSSSEANGGKRGSDQPRQRPMIVDHNEPPPEEEYVNEVLKRMMAESQDNVRARGAGPLELKRDFVCHICHKRHSLVAVFPCGTTTHAYCASHMRARLGIQLSSHSDQISLDYCPICAVTCACSKCQRRVTTLARELKKKASKKGVAPAATPFEDISTAKFKDPGVVRAARVDGPAEPAPERPRRDSNDASATTAGARPADGSQQAKDAPSASSGASVRESPAKLREIKDMIKISKSEFPPEIRGGRVVDPGTAEDYITLHTPEGPIFDSSSNGTTDMWRVDGGRAPDPKDDGNESHCNVCKKPGSMICCDYCPRAFHKKCLQDDEKPLAGETWQCSVCESEQSVLPGDAVDGSVSHPQICAAFRDVESDMNDDDITQLSILSKIHHMVLRLIQYEFGYMFREPVTDVAGYNESIKNPMDLGTIGARLINGDYKEFYGLRKSWDDVHLAVLKDVELVWHNCFTFNRGGSCVYRMAEVHRRRMLSIRKSSFDEDLSENVKQQLADYVKSCARERGKCQDQQVFSTARPLSKQKAAAPKNSNRITRPIAVLDPETGKVVKVYSTVRSAATAAEQIARKYKQTTQDPPLSEHTVKKLVNRSKKDPTILLFGYRWVGLDDLRSGDVIIPRLPDTGPERQTFVMKDTQSIHRFNSLEHALSCPNLPPDLSPELLRKTLQELREGGEGISLAGSEWWRLATDSLEDRTTILHDDGWRDVSLNLSWRPRDEDQLLENATIAKVDLVLRQTVMGFTNLGAAFQDWVRTCQSSPTFHADEEKKESTFYSLYLDGDRNVDGLVWRTIIPKDGSSCVDNDLTSAASNEVLERDSVTVELGKADEVDRLDHEMSTEKDLTKEDGDLPKNGLRENGKHLSDENKASAGTALCTADISVEDKADGRENLPIPQTKGLKRGNQGETFVKRKHTKTSSG